MAAQNFPKKKRLRGLPKDFFLYPPPLTTQVSIVTKNTNKTPAFAYPLLCFDTQQQEGGWAKLTKHVLGTDASVPLTQMMLNAKQEHQIYKRIE